MAASLAITLWAGGLSAQSTGVVSHETLLHIESALQSGEITPEEAILQKLYAGFQPEKVEARFADDSGAPIKCMTPYLVEFEQIRDELPLQTLRMGEALIEQAVPVHSESEYVHLSPSGNFALYYQTTGDNAVPEEDSNGSGIPDYIERAAAMADSSWRYQVETIGFHDFVLDEPYVIRFQRTGFYGYTRQTGGTTEIVIHNTFNGFPENNHREGNRYGSLYVTIAHEIKHAIQYAANRWEGDAGRSDWMEMDAVMMEEVVHPDVDDYYNYLMRYDRDKDDWDRNNTNSNSIFGSPHRGVPGAYYHATWMLYFYEMYGIEFWRDVWERIGEDWERQQMSDEDTRKAYISFLEAVDQQLQSEFTTLASAHLLNHAWHASAGPLKSGFSLGFEDSDNYPNPSFRGTLPAVPDSVISEILSAKGARYYRVEPQGALLGQPGVRLESNRPGANLALIGFFYGGYTDILQLSDPDAQGGILQSTWNWPELSEVIVVVVNNHHSQQISYNLYIDSAVPDEDMISDNFPNPFSGETQINFSVNHRKHVKVEVYDTIGRKIQTLTDQEYGAGFHSVNFDGSGLASGIYFYRIITDEAVITNKMLLLR